MGILEHYWPAALFLLQGLMAWFIWSLRRSFVPKEDFDAHRTERHDASKAVWDRVNVQGRELAVMSEGLKAIPDYRELGSVREQLGAVQGDVKAIAANLDGLREAQHRQSVAVDRIHEYLMARDKAQ